MGPVDRLQEVAQPSLAVNLEKPAGSQAGAPNPGPPPSRKDRASHFGSAPAGAVGMVWTGLTGSTGFFEALPSYQTSRKWCAWTGQVVSIPSNGSRLPEAPLQGSRPVHPAFALFQSPQTGHALPRRIRAVAHNALSLILPRFNPLKRVTPSRAPAEYEHRKEEDEMLSFNPLKRVTPSRDASLDGRSNQRQFSSGFNPLKRVTPSREPPYYLLPCQAFARPFAHISDFRLGKLKKSHQKPCKSFRINHRRSPDLKNGPYRLSFQ